MWIGSLALAGIPPFAGYYSKDAIVSAAYAAGTGVGMYGFVCTVLAAFLTAFYSWRLLFMTFHGKPRADHHVMEHVHESPAVMLVPLVLLAIGAVVAGKALDSAFIGEGWQAFWNGSIFVAANNHVLAAIEQVPAWVGLRTAGHGRGRHRAGLRDVHRQSRCCRTGSPTAFPGVYQFLLNKWYFDELYDRIFVQPTFRLADMLWKVGDATLIDGVPNGLAELATDGSRQVVKLQTGNVAAYAFSMLIGVVALVSIFLLFR